MKTLLNLLDSGESVTGYELEQLVMTAMNYDDTDGTTQDEDERQLAEILYNLYFAETVEQGYKPLKFVYYNLISKNGPEEGVVYVYARRDLYYSPRANKYFDSGIVVNGLKLRDTIVTRSSVTGKELKDMVAELSDLELGRPVNRVNMEEVQEVAFKNLSIQVAKYLDTYFIKSENPIKDDIYYKVSCKEYGTATVYRDLDKSPRKTQNRPQK